MLGAEGRFALSSPPPSTPQVLEKPEKPRRSEGEQLRALMSEMLQWSPVSILRFALRVMGDSSGAAFASLGTTTGLLGTTRTAFPTRSTENPRAGSLLQDLKNCTSGFKDGHPWNIIADGGLIGVHPYCPVLGAFRFADMLVKMMVFATVPRSARRSQHLHRQSRRTVVHLLTDLLSARLAVILLIYHLLLPTLSPTLDALANLSNSSDKVAARYTGLV
ncbi:hypothetical protein FIBSPDRAFT_945418 [Athelia psychrophila]|uniref:Uncharacterized protein n=1 Tax=Athelia psychrophila TaxID=1759441 RepID=A0A166TR78_9AGAM|nr:hypothetical protein FIBSPDRAFT_945418 [Fibularhizoctonia sp. CBS 109695]